MLGRLKYGSVTSNEVSLGVTCHQPCAASYSWSCSHRAPRLRRAGPRQSSRRPSLRAYPAGQRRIHRSCACTPFRMAGGRPDLINPDRNQSHHRQRPFSRSWSGLSSWVRSCWLKRAEASPSSQSTHFGSQSTPEKPALIVYAPLSKIRTFGVVIACAVLY